jgi:hypothetical protein
MFLSGEEIGTTHLKQFILSKFSKQHSCTREEMLRTAADKGYLCNNIFRSVAGEDQPISYEGKS